MAAFLHSADDMTGVTENGLCSHDYGYCNFPIELRSKPHSLTWTTFSLVLCNSGLGYAVYVTLSLTRGQSNLTKAPLTYTYRLDSGWSEWRTPGLCVC